MKKTFPLTALNKKPERQVEAVKYEIRKYIARERRKTLPKDVDYWDFDCKFGSTPTDAIEIHVGEINKKIDEAVLQNAGSFYLEVLAKQGVRSRKNVE